MTTYKVNLPQTSFPMKADLPKREPKTLGFWESINLYQSFVQAKNAQGSFVLHDGPPYANGHLHMGHALTYLLKDFVCKANRMEGKYAPLVPGWDCHGLPIELKVTTERNIEKDRQLIDRLVFKKYCRDYAQHWIEVQRKELKELGKLADYERAYLTMSPEYEADIVRAFATFVEKGYIERKGKTIPWCASCQTVLATAEIEYKDRKDPSIFVLFPFAADDAQLLFPYCFEQDKNLQISFLVWTTTPWTLPLNRAVVLNPKAVYVVIAGKEQHQAYIVAKDLADKLCADFGIEKDILCECDSAVFEGKMAQHPFINGLSVPLLLDESVVIGEGTACMHSAPGCGPEDYLLGIKNNLEIYSPLSADGRYSVGIQPKELEGMAITDAQGWVIKTLLEKNRLVHKASIMHSFPHCWRCHNGLMFRATDQWFCNLQCNNLVQKALAEVAQIQFVPQWGLARLHAFISNRTEWCISRQRQWGVPITALICTKCDTAYLEAGFVKKIADCVAKEGIEFWDRITISELSSMGILPHDFVCEQCGNHDLGKFRQERDILDVWFDSGVSHYAVLAKDQENLGIPADLYLEGSDQHRGWFQSSLLCGMVLNEKAPMKSILTHGYVVDEQKRKMSKSVGNVTAPQDVIIRYSRDILRLWVASADYEGDIVISEKLLGNIAEIYRKIRNTCRFLLSNLYDFDITTDAVAPKDMLKIDQHALAQLHEMSEAVRTAYAEYHFSTVVQTLNNYCTNTLSARYLDIIKDRLYVEKANGLLRRSAQTVLYTILDVLTHLMAPILSFTAEELADFYQNGQRDSIHLRRFVTTQLIVTKDIWPILNQIRDVVLKAIERKREENVIKHPLEAQLTIYFDEKSDDGKVFDEFIKELSSCKNDARFFKDWFIVSLVTFKPISSAVDDNVNQSELSWLAVSVTHADGIKCQRCWQWEITNNIDHLCSRCCAILEYARF